MFISLGPNNSLGVNAAQCEQVAKRAILAKRKNSEIRNAKNMSVIVTYPEKQPIVKHVSLPCNCQHGKETCYNTLRVQEHSTTAWSSGWSSSFVMWKFWDRSSNGSEYVVFNNFPVENPM